MKKVFLSLSVLVLLATACKKDKDEETAQNVTPTKENLTGSYKISKVEGIQGNQRQDVTNQVFEPCEIDDIYKLNADLTYQRVDAGQTCGNDVDDSWEFISATSIKMEGVTYTIDKFDGKTLQLSYIISADTKFTSTFNKQ
jgi:hypothetical protein